MPGGPGEGEARRAGQEGRHQEEEEEEKGEEREGEGRGQTSRRRLAAVAPAKQWLTEDGLPGISCWMQCMVNPHCSAGETVSE